MSNAIATVHKILEHGKQFADNSSVKVSFEKGNFCAQGDINIWKLNNLPRGVIEIPPVQQLAPGTSRGSRHCISMSSIPGMKFYRVRRPNPLQGPIFFSEREIEIEHPEHGNIILPGGYYFVSYQRRYADDLKRVED